MPGNGSEYGRRRVFRIPREAGKEQMEKESEWVLTAECRLEQRTLAHVTVTAILRNAGDCRCSPRAMPLVRPEGPHRYSTACG